MSGARVFIIYNSLTPKYQITRHSNVKRDFYETVPGPVRIGSDGENHIGYYFGYIPCVENVDVYGL